MGDSNVVKDGSIWAWNPSSKPTNRVTSQFPSLPPDPELRGYQEAAATGLTGIPLPDQTGSSMADLIKLFGSRGSGSQASDVLARDKFNYEKKQDANKTSGLSDYYTGGSYNTGFNALLEMISKQGEVSKGAVTDAYGRALKNVNQGYDAAKGLGDQGYSALNTYLAANQNNPYAGMQASVGSAPDALSSYLSAYGVSDQPVQGQIQADQLQAQQGAGNYQNLISLLGGIAEQGSASRGAESQMAQLLFNTGLGQERAGYTSQAENAQAQALAALQQTMFQSRFDVEEKRNVLAQQLAQTVSELTGKAPGGDGNGNETPPATNFAAEIAAAYAPKEAAYNRPAQTNEQIAALRAQQEEERRRQLALTARR